MNNNEILMYLGIFLLAIFVIYFLSNMANIQRNVIEGLTSKSSNNKSSINLGDGIESEAKNIKKMNEQLNDSWGFDKYKSDYEDIIIALDEYIDNMILFFLVSKLGKKYKDPYSLIEDLANTDKDNNSIIKMLNEFYKFKENLNSTMDYLNSKKSSNNSTSNATSKAKNMFGF